MKFKMILVASAIFATPAMARNFGEHGGYDVSASEGTSAKDRGFCGMREEFGGPGESRLTIFRSVENPEIVKVVVDNYNWTTKKGEEYKGIVYNFNGQFYERDATGIVDSSHHGLLTGFPATEFLDTFAKAKSLHVYRDKKVIDQLSLDGSGAARAAFGRCWAYLLSDDRAKTRDRLADDLAKTRERNRYSHIPKNPFGNSVNDEPRADGGTRARVFGSLPGLFSSDDYPQSALRNDETGTVGFSLIVGTNGRVSNCSVVSSSGSSSLDATTCSIIVRRSRFTPARDASENPVSDTFEGRIKWSLPAAPVETPAVAAN